MQKTFGNVEKHVCLVLKNVRRDCVHLTWNE